MNTEKPLWQLWMRAIIPITFGSVVTFKASSIGSSGAGAFNAAAGKIDFIYKDESDSSKAKFITGTVSGTTISIYR